MRLKLFSIFLVILLQLIIAESIAQTTAVFNISGTWTCPSGVNSIQVECWGAGGGGGGSTSSSSKYVGGGGAGGNYVKNASIAVTPGNVYTISVGSGGTGGGTSTSTCNGSSGSATSFSGSGVTTVTATGGNAGLGGQSSLTAGTGGNSSLVGNAGYSSAFSYAGGAGTNGTWTSSTSGKSGPGGGSAGTDGYGNTSATGILSGGVAASGGGNGGAGLSSTGMGNDGIFPGGGGAGGFGSSGSGGKGGNGKVIITYNNTTTPILFSSTNTTPLSVFYTTNSFASAIQSFTISGNNLNSTIKVACPSGYEVTLNNNLSPFSDSIVLSPSSGNLGNTIIYVRLKQGLLTGSYNQNIVVSAAGANAIMVGCNGTVSNDLVPTIDVPSMTTIAGFNYGVGYGPSIEQSVTISAQNLIDSIKIYFNNSNYEVSANPDSNYISGTDTLKLEPTEGFINTTIYLRLKAGLTIGNYLNNQVVLTSTNANVQTIICNGTVTATPVIVRQPSNITICEGNSTIFISKAAPYQTVKWQRSTDGTSWVDIYTNLDSGTVYSGFNTDTLRLTGSTESMDYFQYRAYYNTAISNTAILTVTSTLTDSIQINGLAALCVGSFTTFTCNTKGVSASNINPDDFIAPKFSAVTVTSNVAYAAPNGSFHLVDVYQPTGDTTKRRPAVMFLHGGGFRNGNDKTQSYVVSFCTYLAKCGFVAFAPNYNVGGGHTFSQNLLAVQDADLCMNWIRSNGQTYGYDANYLFEGGGSAGGHLSCNWMFADGDSKYNGFIPNLSNIIAFANCWGSSPDADRLYKYTSINSNAMPVFTVHGTSDATVSISISDTLNKYIANAGAYYNYWRIPGETHGCPNHIAAISDTMALFFNRAWKRKGTVSSSTAVEITGGFWTSSNVNVATIDATTGVLSAISPGTTIITYVYATCAGNISTSKIIAINAALTAASTIVACDTYSWRGATYTTSGDKIFTKSNVNSCDSIITLHLTLNASSHNSFTQSACRSYAWNGVSYTSSGVYLYNYTNGSGCSSTDTLKLTIFPAASASTTITSCESYLWNGITYSNSGDYTYTYFNGYGCSVTDTLHLTIRNSLNTSTAVVACDSYTWSLNAITYSVSGVYIHSSSLGSCVSTDTLRLTINQSTHNVTNSTSCDSYLWSRNNLFYTSSGTYYYEYTNASGCLSADTLKLIITPCNSQYLLTTNYSTNGVLTSWYNVAANCLLDTLSGSTVAGLSGIRYNSWSTPNGQQFGTRGASASGLAGDGTTATASVNNNLGKWIQFRLRPSSSAYKLSVTGISMNVFDSTTSTTYYGAILYSTDGTTWVSSDGKSITVTPNGTSGAGTNIPVSPGVTIANNNLNLTINAGGYLFVRFIPMRINANFTSSEMTISDIKITGSVTLVAPPSINTSVSSLAGFSYAQSNGPSSVQSFSVSASYLTSTITIASPSSYEISTAMNSGFTNNITLAGTGGTLTSTNIYVRLKSGLSANSYNEDIVITTFGVASKTISCAGLIVVPQTNLNLKVFLSGLYVGNGLMRPLLYNRGLSQNANETDSLEINLWSPVNLNNSYPDYTAKTIVYTDGTLNWVFPASTFNKSYYISIKHRNSVETWSSVPIIFNAITSVDFTTALSTAYSNDITNPLQYLEPGKIGIYSGDLNQDGGIDLLDLQTAENNAVLLTSGYTPSDCNGDGATDDLDVQIIKDNCGLFIYRARPY